MSRFLYIFSLVSSLFSLSCSDSYRIKGFSNLQSVDGKTVAMMISEEGEWRVLDSCEVLHGQFRMNGRADSNMIVTLFLDGQPIMPMILEPGQMDVVISNLEFKVAGTPLNDSLYKFIARKYKLDLRTVEMERMESQMIMNGYPLDVIQQRVDSAYQKLNDDMLQLVCGFIGDNYDNVLSLCGFSMLCNGLPYPVITPLIQKVIDDAPKAFLEQPLISEFLRTARENMDGRGVADVVVGQ